MADIIEADFKAVGIRLIRDIQNLSDSKQLKQLSRKLKKNDCVWMIISAEFIACEQCMLPFCQVLKDHTYVHQFNLINAISPDETVCINTLNKQKEFWKNKLTKAEEICAEDLSSGSIEQFIQYQTINEEFDHLISRFLEMPELHFETLKSQHYSNLINGLAYDEKDIIKEAMLISSIQKRKEKEQAIDLFLSLHPDNHFALYLNALQEISSNVCWKAKMYFQQRVDANPKDILATEWLAYILSDHFMDIKTARKYLLKILTINPTEVSALVQLGVLQEKHFNDFKNAKKNYEKAIKANPHHAEALYRLGYLIETQIKDTYEAKSLYERAVEANPKHINALYCLAHILQQHYAQYRNAYDLYMRVLKIDSKHDDAHYNVAHLYNHHFGIYMKAKKHYVSAFANNPKNEQALYEMAVLLYSHYKEYTRARKYYQRLLAVNPSHTMANYNLARILVYEYKEKESAVYYYKLAVANDKSLIDKQMDKLLGIKRKVKPEDKSLLTKVI